MIEGWVRATRIRCITLPPHIWRKLKAARIRGYFARDARGRRGQRAFGVLGHGTHSEEGNACWECYFAKGPSKMRAARIGIINMFHLSFVFRRQVTPRRSRGKAMLRIRAAHGSNGRCPRPSLVTLRKVTLPMRAATRPVAKQHPECALPSPSLCLPPKIRFRMRAALTLPWCSVVE